MLLLQASSSIACFLINIPNQFLHEIVIDCFTSHPCAISGQSARKQLKSDVDLPFLPLWHLGIPPYGAAGLDVLATEAVSYTMSFSCCSDNIIFFLSRPGIAIHTGFMFHNDVVSLLILLILAWPTLNLLNIWYYGVPLALLFPVYF